MCNPKVEVELILILSNGLANMQRQSAWCKLGQSTVLCGVVHNAITNVYLILEKNGRAYFLPLSFLLRYHPMIAWAPTGIEQEPWDPRRECQQQTMVPCHRQPAPLLGRPSVLLPLSLLLLLSCVTGPAHADSEYRPRRPWSALAALYREQELGIDQGGECLRLRVLLRLK